MPDDLQLASLSAFRARVVAMPRPDEAAAEQARAHDAQLTKPAGALGRLETLARWAAAWQGRHPPRAERIQVVVFAGNHGVVAQGVSAYPAAVTAQMVANFEAGGAAINQLCGVLGAALTVVPLDLDTPTEDMTERPALERSGLRRCVGGGDGCSRWRRGFSLPRRDGDRQHHRGSRARGGALWRRRRLLGGAGDRSGFRRPRAQVRGGRCGARAARRSAPRSSGRAQLRRRAGACGDHRRRRPGAAPPRARAARRLRLHRRGGGDCEAAG